MLIHSTRHDVRGEAVESARIAGRLGAVRVPDSVLFPHGQELSDTAIVRCVVALEEGRAERAKRLESVDKCMRWLAVNREPLAEEIERAGVKDGEVDLWLKAKFQAETGEML